MSFIQRNTQPKIRAAKKTSLRTVCGGLNEFNVAHRIFGVWYNFNKPIQHNNKGY